MTKPGSILDKIATCRNKGRQYWLMKSEPNAYSIDDLKSDGVTPWDGVRNYQARNLMMKEMKVGDAVLFYHSNAKPAGVVGIAKVSKTAFPDPSAFDKKSKYFDSKSQPDNPRWFCVEVAYVKHLPRMVSLPELRTSAALEEMLVLQKGQRLSILPCTKTEFDCISKLAQT